MTDCQAVATPASASSEHVGLLPTRCISSMISVQKNCHRSTARTHVQPASSPGCCSDFAPGWRRSACLRQPALSAKSGRDKPTCAHFAPCCSGGVLHLKKSSTELDAATGGLQSSPWRCGLCAAEALTSSLRLEDVTSSPRSGGDDRRSRTTVRNKTPCWKDL